jgi:hypothetical protein
MHVDIRNTVSVVRTSSNSLRPRPAKVGTLNRTLGCSVHDS